MWMLVIILVYAPAGKSQMPVIFAKDYRKIEACQQAAKAINEMLPVAQRAGCVRQP